MQLSYLLSCLVVLACASRLFIGAQAVTCSENTITAKYDDLPAQPPAVIPHSIGPYRGLQYNNINLLTLGVAGSPPPAGLVPASNPNVVAFGLFEATTTSNVTVAGGGAGYKAFTAFRISYGCIVGTVESITNVPTSCTIAISGYKAGVQVVRQLEKFEVATGQVNKAMSVTNLADTFRRLDTVKFELVTPSQLAAAVLLDDFKYAGCK